MLDEDPGVIGGWYFWLKASEVFSSYRTYRLFFRRAIIGERGMITGSHCEQH